jgi:hypothetical protein
MGNFLVSDDAARAMYVGGRGNATARRFARVWRWVFAAGLFPLNQRAPILRRYVDKVPGGRPHIPVAKGAPLADFEAIAASYPVFEVSGLRHGHAVRPED